MSHHNRYFVRTFSADNDAHVEAQINELVGASGRLIAAYMWTTVQGARRVTCYFEVLRGPV